MVKESQIFGEYSSKGDYHKNLDKNWKYYPIYVEKMKKIRKILGHYKDKKILDAGCREGLLVEEFKKRGFNITGIDLNYKSINVIKGNVKNMPFKNGQFDLVLCLDVLEHIDISQHKEVIEELCRVTKRGGELIFGLPNLAHFASRIKFLLTGELLRTSEIERHVGDRPIKEFIDLMKNNKLIIEKRIGLFPTFPVISYITIKCPYRSLNLHRVYNKILSNPGWCFENIITARKI